MKRIYPEQQFKLDYNKMCGKLLKQERLRQGVDIERLAEGIVSKTQLEAMEDGNMPWSKVAGDILLHRMGIDPCFFELVETSEEIERWRKREDICLAFPAKGCVLTELVEQYRHQYPQRNHVEEQFLEKVVLLQNYMRWCEGDSSADWNSLRYRARHAVQLTVSGNWQKGLEGLLLAPAELEMILVAGAIELADGADEEAWRLQQMVWYYPQQRGWDVWITKRILPQAALLGMDILSRKGEAEEAFHYGCDAVRILQGRHCHRYIVPLLGKMLKQPVTTGQAIMYQQRAGKWLEAFNWLYERFEISSQRLWQTISIDNTREIGRVLEAMRKNSRKTLQESVRDENGEIISMRQLQRIERGHSKPFRRNYERLAENYGYLQAQQMPIYEADSVFQLRLRREICLLLEQRRWEEAEYKFHSWWTLVKQKEHPKAKQQKLFLEEILRVELSGGLVEHRKENMQKVLECTCPNMNWNCGKYGVFSIEEGEIIGNIAKVYREEGCKEKARKIMEILMQSYYFQAEKSRVLYHGYQVVLSNYSSLLGDFQEYEQSIKMDQELIELLLLDGDTYHIMELLYEWGWNLYELKEKDHTLRTTYREQWQHLYRLSCYLADYLENDFMRDFLKAREEKYLSSEIP